MRIHNRRILTFLFLFCLVLILASCNQSKTSPIPTLPLEEPDPDFCRITMGMGFADKNEEYLYVTDLTNLYEMDLETKKVLPVKNIIDSKELNLVGDQLYYMGLFSSTIQKYDFGKSEVVDVYDEANITDIYVFDRYIYALTGRCGSLVRIDSESGEAIELAPTQVLLYNKFGSELYYIFWPDEDSSIVLKCLNEHTGVTTEYDLPFEPISLFVTQDYIYLLEQGILIDDQYHYQMYRYNKENGDIERIEGVDQTLNYYVVDDRIYYHEEDTDYLICYSLKDHTKELITENIIDFTVFSDEDIVVFKSDDDNDVGYCNIFLERNENGEWEQTKVRPE